MTGTPPSAGLPWWATTASEGAAAALTAVWVSQLVLAAGLAGTGVVPALGWWALGGACALLAAGSAPTWVHLRRTRLTRRLAGHIGP